jgi:hypothetical protein
VPPSSDQLLGELHRLRVERDARTWRDEHRRAHVVCRVCDARDEVDRAIGMCPSCQRVLGLARG